MYNNFTNTLIYKHFHILNTSINFHYTFIYTFLQIFVALALILHTPLPPNFLNAPHPHYPPSNFFSFPQISKLPPPNYFYLILFFSFFYKLLISPSNFPSNFLYNAIYTLCLLFVLLYVYSFVITHFRGVYGYSNICYIATTFTRCTLYDD